MREGDEHQLVTTHKIDDSVREDINLATANNRQAIPARKWRPRLRTPLNVRDRGRHYTVEVRTESSLNGLVVSDSVKKLGLRRGMHA